MPNSSINLRGVLILKGRVRKAIGKAKQNLKQRRLKNQPHFGEAKRRAIKSPGKAISAKGLYSKVTAGYLEAGDTSRLRLSLKRRDGKLSKMDITVPPTKGQKRARAISRRMEKVGEFMNRNVGIPAAVRKAAKVPGREFLTVTGYKVRATGETRTGRTRVEAYKIPSRGVKEEVHHYKKRRLTRKEKL